MKTKMTVALTAAIGLLAFGLHAQANGPEAGGPPPRGNGGHRPPPSPLIGALDANHDHVIDATEIANASAALLTLDKNGDGILTTNEYLPPLPPNSAGDTTHRPPVPAILKALDANHDGVIDADEIANASAVLKTLDKNGDGQLTPDEFDGTRPPPRGGDRNIDNGQNPTEDAPPGPPPGE